MTIEKTLSRRLRYDLVQLRGNSCFSTSLKKVSSTYLRDKLQFVNSVKRSVLDLTKFSTIRIFSQNQIWLIGFRVMSSFVQVVIYQNELKLLGTEWKNESP